jgi:hypothetical protein
MLDARGALVGGLAIFAITLVLVLSQSPHVLAGKNDAAAASVASVLTSVPGGGHFCQANETLPIGVSEIRLSLAAVAGPRVKVTVMSGKTILTHGESAPGWLGYRVTAPVKPVNHTLHHTTVCVAFSGAKERVSFRGMRTATRRAAWSDGHFLPGRIAVEYSRPGTSSWWSQALSVARRFGLGRAWAGTWLVLLVAGLMAAAFALTSWLVIRELR